MAPLERIEQHLHRLVQRQRRLLGLRALLQVSIVLLIGAVLPAALLSSGVRVGVALGLGGGLALLGAAAAVLWPLAARWRPAGELLHQARAVEALEPRLEQRLATVVGRAALLRSGRSPLLAQAAEKAAVQALELEPARVHPVQPLAPLAGGLAAAVLVFVLGASLLPIGPQHLLDIIRGGSVAEARLAEVAEPVGEDRVVVGDIVLRYVFPDYTGAEPVEVPNSDGTIHAPPGTRVEIRARTERGFEAVALQVDGGPPVDGVLFGGRDISAALTVEQAGTWRFLLFEGEQAFQSNDFRIEVEADAEPVVALDRTPPTRVPVDSPVPLSWSVQDDFGIERVVLEVETPDGTVTELPLRTPLDPTRELRGSLRLTPRDLGLTPGRSAKLRVVAYDNDIMGGNKRGVSPEVDIEAQGAQGRSDQLIDHSRKLRDALIEVLAAFLEEPSPNTGSTPAMQAWIGTARKRFEPVHTLQRERWGETVGDSYDAQLVARIDTAAGRLFRYTMTTWEPGSRRRITPGDESQFSELRDEVIVSVEAAVYALDLLLRQVGMQELGEQAEALAREAAELASLSETAEAGELLARLDQLQRMMDQLAKASAKLGEGNMQEFVNSRTEQARNLMDEIRKAIAEGRMEDARRMMERMAEDLRQMAEGINDQIASQQTGGDELGEQLDEAMAELEKLEADQRQLAQELEDTVNELGEGVSEQIQKWTEIERLAEEAVQHATSAVQGTGDGEGWRASSIRVLEQSRAKVERVRDAVRARQAQSALERVYEAQRPAMKGNRVVRMERERGRPSTQPLPGGLPGVESATEDVLRVLRELEEKLDELVSEQQSSSPEVEQAAQELAQRQSELGQRQEQLERQVRQVEQSMPLAEGKANEAMKQAGEAMKRAEQSLEQGEALQGQGHQQEAADRLKEARDQLQNTREQQQQMNQQQQNQRRGERPSGDNREEGSSPPPNAQLELPHPEQFRTPEEYRRALLEGMAGEVPDEYRALNKRYFEELVRQ
jgi:hypothetical protein